MCAEQSVRVGQIVSAISAARARRKFEGLCRTQFRLCALISYAAPPALVPNSSSWFLGLVPNIQRGLRAIHTYVIVIEYATN
ncbi:unnamed protein product [Leptosia nina]|uniref:Uncharacterized protein n=1 Tax=Leptosia nina TaxID=320188 RepID=A0AAV1K3F4_9NEOP